MTHKFAHETRRNLVCLEFCKTSRKKIILQKIWLREVSNVNIKYVCL